MLEFEAAKPESGGKMTDFFENVGLLVALCMSGAGVVTIVVVMVLKFLDAMEDRRRD